MSAENRRGARSFQRLSVASVFATLGVILSLGLVAWELRQNTIATRAATYDRIGESSAQYYWEVARDPELAAIFRDVFNGVPFMEIDPVDRTRFIAVALAFTTHLENTWQQYEAGVVGEDVFDGYGWQDGLLMSRAFRDWWNPDNQRAFYSDDFVEYLDRHLKELDLGDASD